jgi:hypothetical protein
MQVAAPVALYWDPPASAARGPDGAAPPGPLTF